MDKMLKQVISILLAVAILIPSGLFAPVTEAATSEIPVLLYHRIVDTATNEWTDTSVDKFKSTMKYLYAIGRYYIQMSTTLSEIANWIGGPAPDLTAPSTSLSCAVKSNLPINRHWGRIVPNGINSPVNYRCCIFSG